MTNKDLIQIFKTIASLLELIDANPFKVKGYSNAAFNIEKLQSPIIEFPESEWKDLGISKSFTDKIRTLQETRTLEELEELRQQIPESVVKMLSVRGLGTKKIRTLWQEYGIDSKEKLREVCQNGELSKMKGFGAKTAEKILQSLEFEDEQRGKVHVGTLDVFVEDLISVLKEAFPEAEIVAAGEYERKTPILQSLQILITNTGFMPVKKLLAQNPNFELDIKNSSPVLLRSKLLELEVPVEFHFIKTEELAEKQFLLNSAPAHIKHLRENNADFSVPFSEEKVYNSIQQKVIPAIAREAVAEFKEGFDFEKLVQQTDLKGSLHNHSSYSDGKHSLKEMADYCKELGYEYLGISDHSVTSFYANGLNEERILLQHKEIEKLNANYNGFKIFKGIESDILNNGSLDYREEVLKSFDFIVSSIHSNLEMDKETATKRIITAIENPYTTILGHWTGRLLLRRNGYPLDYKKVIDACAANKVVIEINSNPWRLDIDWTLIPYCLEKEVMLSINPDAHEQQGYHHMKYGVYMAQKAGVPKEFILNTYSLEEIDSYFKNRGK